MNKLIKYKVFDITDNKERNVSLIQSNLQPGEIVTCTIGNIPHRLKVLETLTEVK